jgi:hypothetical protein
MLAASACCAFCCARGTQGSVVIWVSAQRGHAKAEHRMGRNFLKGPHGDAANAVLAAAGYNFRRLLAWLAMIWRVFSAAILAEIVQFAIIKPV